MRTSPLIIFALLGCSNPTVADVAGTYRHSETGDRLELFPDGRYSLVSYRGPQVSRGKYLATNSDACVSVSFEDWGKKGHWFETCATQSLFGRPKLVVDSDLGIDFIKEQ